jgi:hypothetical protein
VIANKKHHLINWPPSAAATRFVNIAMAARIREDTP